MAKRKKNQGPRTIKVPGKFAAAAGRERKRAAAARKAGDAALKAMTDRKAKASGRPLSQSRGAKRARAAKAAGTGTGG